LRERIGTGPLGVIQSQQELEKLWSHLSSIDESDYAKVPPAPAINFALYSVVWFTLANTGGSSAEFSDMMEYDNAILMKVKVERSDILSTDLDLWKIPKTVKPIMYQEERSFVPGP
jgi:hypothetical protein